jgi:uncharacterized HAD superfamily protein
MKKVVVTVDLDDVTWDFNTPFAEYHNRLYGTDVSYSDITTFSLPAVYGIDRDLFHDRVHDFCHHEHHTIPLIEGAHERLSEMNEAGIELQGVTSRWDMLRQITENHLSLRELNVFTGIHFANKYPNQHESKKHICVRLGSQCHIDDAFHHAVDVSGGTDGIPVLLMDKPWNQDKVPPNVHRCGRWTEPRSTWDHAFDWIDRNLL